MALFLILFFFSPAEEPRFFFVQPHMLLCWIAANAEKTFYTRDYLMLLPMICTCSLHLH